MKIRSENLTPRSLEDAVESCLEDPKYKTNSERLRGISERYVGIERASSAINGFL
ncbi:MAG: hypothetical protein ACREBQ_05535 [Nitrososphaerales archaeon]